MSGLSCGIGEMMRMTSDQAVAIAQSEIGTKENPSGSNKVKYNTWYYGKEVSGDSYPWCCAFISWIFKGTNLVKKTALCADLMQWFMARKQMVERPLKGDIVFFKFGKTTRIANHVGIVEEASQWPANITSIEGNTSVTSDDNGGRVMRRTRSKANIVGFARPEYEGKVQNTIGVKDKPTLKMGSKGDWVKVAQARLLMYGYQIEVDGDFGPNTKNAVVSFQASYGLTKDGIIGPKTWAKLYP